MIFLIGSPNDSVLNYFAKELKLASIPNCFINLTTAGVSLHFDISMTSEGLFYKLMVGDMEYQISNEDVMISRCPSLSNNDFALLVGSFLEGCPARVFNRPRFSHYLLSKPLQLINNYVVSEQTTRPLTIVTNQLERIREIVNLGKTFVFKSMSGVRSKVEELELNEHAVNIIHCPVMFQEKIEPTRNVKVHVYGDHISATEVCSERIDYRARDAKAHFTDIVPNRTIKEITQIVRKMTGYTFFDFDLVGDAGSEFFLEVNPSPVPTYYDDKTGGTTSRQILQFICSGGNHATRLE